MNRKALAFLVAVMACTTASAGTVFQLELREYSEDPPREGSMALTTEGESARMETSYADGRDAGGMIFLGDAGQMIALDHAEREYYVLDEAGMQKMAGEVGSAMREALEGMPPEQRAMVEQMMKSRMPQAATDPVTLHRTGGSATVNGYACTSYQLRRAGATVQELCVADWGDIEGGRDAAEAMTRMGRFFQDLVQQLSDALGMDVLGEQQQFLAHLEELDGWPVLVREFDEDGELWSEVRLVSAETTNVDPELFQAPAGYRRTETGM